MEQVCELVVRAKTAVTLDERVAAYGQLVERFRDMACGYVYAILGDFHLAEDAAQEAFVTAYRRLEQLREPQAYPGWFRSIVWTTCGQITRRKSMPTVPMDAAREASAKTPGPSEMAEAAEMRDEVLRAISQLPDPQREVTALFYINEYSQKDIADFLEVPVGTVNSRLTASRSRLKRRMLNMVKDTLHQNAPDERFDQKVIDQLLTHPRPLQIPDHPVRQALDAIKAALADYRVIDADSEIEDKQVAHQAEDHAWEEHAYRLGDKALRFQMTTVTMDAVAGCQPPVRVMAAGRVFDEGLGSVGPRLSYRDFCLTIGGKIGELVQGVQHDIGPFLVGGTLSSSPDSNWVQVSSEGPLTLISADGGELSKTWRAVANYLDLIGADPAAVCGRVELHRRTPVGKGRGSSSLDAALGVFGVARANDLPAHPRTVYRALCRVERSDPVWMASDLVLAQPEAGEFEVLGAQPDFLLVGWDACPQGTVDTQDAAALDRSRRQHLADYDHLLCLVRSGDLNNIQQAATLSACLNDRYLPKPAFDWALAVARDMGVGLMCAHSGTYLALMLPAAASPEMLGAAMALVRGKGFVPEIFLMGCGGGHEHH